MALTQGTNSNFPCPVCLVPKEEMSRGLVYALHITETMKEVYNKAKEKDTAEECEKLLNVTNTGNCNQDKYIATRDL